MRVGLFNSVDGGLPRFQAFEEGYRDDLEIRYYDCAPSIESLEMAGRDGVTGLIYYNPKREDEAFFKKMADVGIRYLTTTSTGYDHFDLEAMKKYGIKGANVPAYSPNAISPSSSVDQSHPSSIGRSM